MESYLQGARPLWRASFNVREQNLVVLQVVETSACLSYDYVQGGDKDGLEVERLQMGYGSPSFVVDIRSLCHSR